MPATSKTVPPLKRRGRSKSNATATALNLAHLTTEQSGAAFKDLDLKSTREILRLINREDTSVPRAVRHALPAITRATDFAIASFHQGGRLIYVGAGTSGRLGVLDASECPPTYNVPPTQVQGLLAGGRRALISAAEASEDNAAQGAKDLRKLRVDARDTVLGVAASGRTPYTLGALEHARAAGARTVGLACVAGSPMAQRVDVMIETVTGPEVVSGSTRMKAGTAQKLVLNMISTTAMVRTGHVFGNLMIDVHQHNAKLVARAESILRQATGLAPAAARQLLRRAGSVRVAIVAARLGLPVNQARERLVRANGNMRRALGDTPAL